MLTTRNLAFSVLILGLAIGVVLYNLQSHKSPTTVNSIQSPPQETSAFTQLAEKALLAADLTEEVQGVWRWQSDHANMTLILQGQSFTLTSYFSDKNMTRTLQAKGDYSIQGQVIQFKVTEGERNLFSAQSRVLVEKIGTQELLIREHNNRLIPFQRQNIEALPVQL